ncbi:phage tail protein [Escherichia coli]|nr:phage tail protein [Escherichia coli]
MWRHSLAEHGGWKAFLWTPPYARRQIKVTCAALVITGSHAAG